MMSNHANKVEVQGFYGGDLTHALSGWTSTNRNLSEEKRARIPQFLKRMAEEGHGTPFEKSMLHFLVTCDTATHIHLIKHRIGVSVNAESARYKELGDDKFLVPEDWPEPQKQAFTEHMLVAYYRYHSALENLTPVLGRKRAKESARFYLPYGIQVQVDISFNFRSFMLFQKLRNDDHAQDEVHWVAKEMLELTRATGQFNASLEAFGYGDKGEGAQKQEKPTSGQLEGYNPPSLGEIRDSEGWSLNGNN